MVRKPKELVDDIEFAVKRSNSELTQFSTYIDSDDVEELVEAYREVLETLRFYKNPDHWETEIGVPIDTVFTPGDTEPANGNLAAPGRDYIAGRKAREVLKEQE